MRINKVVYFNMSISKNCPKESCDGESIIEKYSEVVCLNYLEDSPYVTIEIEYCDSCGAIINSKLTK